MDVDGTLTDGKIYISNSGEEMKAFSVKDGYAIKEILPKLDIIPVIITGRKSKIVELRSTELGITEVYQGIGDKYEVYEMLKNKYEIQDENIIYIGDDFNDYVLLEKSGYAACPADAIDELKEICTYVASRKGGEGAVAEIILRLFEMKNNTKFTINK
jgi:3-deoxy-D-manno-octulosonate 8-phosphate phosphatase (KDO 8-P phosphatase)